MRMGNSLQVRWGSVSHMEVMVKNTLQSGQQLKLTATQRSPALGSPRATFMLCVGQFKHFVQLRGPRQRDSYLEPTSPASCRAQVEQHTCMASTGGRFELDWLTFIYSYLIEFHRVLLNSWILSNICQCFSGTIHWRNTHTHTNKTGDHYIGSIHHTAMCSA